MDIFDGVKVMLRWWFVVVALFAVTLAAAMSMTSDIQPEYRAEAAVLMVGPAVRESSSRPGEFESLNPLLDQPSVLATVALVVSLSVQGPQAEQILADEGLTASFEVGVERNAPIVLLETRAESRDVALRSAQGLAEIIDEEVRLRQDAADVPANERVTTSVIQLAAVGGADYEGRNRTRLLILGLGIGMTVAVVFLLEGYRRRRATKTLEGGDHLEDLDEFDAGNDQGVESENEGVQGPSAGGYARQAAAEKDLAIDPNERVEVVAFGDDVHAKRSS